MRYKVVFHGDVPPEAEIDDAKQKLAPIFKLKSEAVDRLFSGKAVTIRKHADAATAKKYQKAAAGCGVIFPEPAYNPRLAFP